MLLLLYGTNHTRMSVEQREELALSEQELPDILSQLLDRPSFHEACIITTCNRVEFIVAADEDACLPRTVRELYEKRQGLDLRSYSDAFYFYEGDEVAEHLFRVVTSLDSMVIGEVDITHQVKRMYQIANEAGATGMVLDQAFHQAFKVGKQARTDTDISRGTMSVAMAAAEYVQSKAGDLSELDAVVVGSGKMALQMARYLKKRGAASITLANRTVENVSEQAARLGAEVAPLSDLERIVAASDLLMVSIDFDKHHLLSTEDIARIAAQRDGKALSIVDISVPRVVEHMAEPPADIEIFDIEDFQPILDENFKRRREAVSEVERIIERAVRRFSVWTQESAILPDVIRLRKKVKAIQEEELERWSEELPEEMLPVLRNFAEALSERIIQMPIQSLKSNALGADPSEPLSSFRRLFALEDKAGSNGVEANGNGASRAGRSREPELGSGASGSAESGSAESRPATSDIESGS